MTTKEPIKMFVVVVVNPTVNSPYQSNIIYVAHEGKKKKIMHCGESFIYKTIQLISFEFEHIFVLHSKHN